MNIKAIHSKYDPSAKAAKLLAGNALKLHSAFCKFENNKMYPATKEQLAERLGLTLQQFENAFLELIEARYIIEYPDNFTFYTNGTSTPDEFDVNALNDNYYVVKEWIGRKEW